MSLACRSPVTPPPRHNGRAIPTSSWVTSSEPSSSRIGRFCLQDPYELDDELWRDPSSLSSGTSSGGHQPAATDDQPDRAYGHSHRQHILGSPCLWRRLPSPHLPSGATPLKGHCHRASSCLGPSPFFATAAEATTSPSVARNPKFPLEMGSQGLNFHHQHPSHPQQRHNHDNKNCTSSSCGNVIFVILINCNKWIKKNKLANNVNKSRWTTASSTTHSASTSAISVGKPITK